MVIGGSTLMLEAASSLSSGNSSYEISNSFCCMEILPASSRGSSSTISSGNSSSEINNSFCCAGISPASSWGSSSTISSSVLGGCRVNYFLSWTDFIWLLVGSCYVVLLRVVAFWWIFWDSFFSLRFLVHILHLRMVTLRTFATRTKRWTEIIEEFRPM